MVGVAKADLEVVLGDIGNWVDCKAGSRIVVPGKEPFMDDFVIKPYTIAQRNERFYDEEYLRAFDSFVFEQARTLRDGTTMGMGFSILSDGYLNLGMWGIKDNPVVLSTRLFRVPSVIGIGKPVGDLSEEVDVKEEGVFCCWEAKIVGHESAAWIKYLRSPKTLIDKESYLKDRISGII